MSATDSDTTPDNAAHGGCPAVPCYVSADYLLENSWAWNIEGWYEATKDGNHRQFVRVRLDIESQKYVLDVVGQDRKYSEELWRYKGGDWLFLSHNAIGEARADSAAPLPPATL